LLVEGRSEFYELSYWIWQYNKVLKYPTRYLYQTALAPVVGSRIS
jgi:hypothetical protein